MCTRRFLAKSEGGQREGKLIIFDLGCAPDWVRDRHKFDLVNEPLICGLCAIIVSCQ